MRVEGAGWGSRPTAPVDALAAVRLLRPGPQKRRIGGTLSLEQKVHRDRGHPQLGEISCETRATCRGLRNRLRLSQGRFADSFGLSVDAVRHWESGRRQPEAAARALLIVIAADPEFVMRSLAKSA